MKSHSKQEFICDLGMCYSYLPFIGIGYALVEGSTH